MSAYTVPQFGHCIIVLCTGVSSSMTTDSHSINAVESLTDSGHFANSGSDYTLNNLATGSDYLTTG